jgi:hypothetical protein
MALASPGVEVTIIDQAQYLPAPTNSIPFILLATAQNKADPTSTRVAPGTTAANANKLYRVTSQRDLVALYGNPFFYTTSNGTPIQGYELNEYGLLAAYSALGATNTVYTLRADIDLASLVGSTGRPTGDPEDGTFWLDTTSSTWGVYEFDATTGQFSIQSPLIITDTALISGGVPVASVGQIGDYAINAVYADNAVPSNSTAKEYFYKASNNTWVPIGGYDWLGAWPTIQATNSNPTLTPGDTITISLSGDNTATITVQAAPNNLLSVLVNDINSLDWTYLSATITSGKMNLFSKQTGGDGGLNPTNPYHLTVSGTGTLLNDLGIVSGTYYQPGLAYGTSAQQPLWQASQTYPRPTGSVWIKVGASGGGLLPVVSQWNDLLKAWLPKNVTLSQSDWAVIGSMDATGGKAIPANSIYAQYNFNGDYNQGPVYLWQRVAEGPTVVTGTNNAPSFTNGPYTALVQVSLPGSNVLSSVYTFNLADNTNATDFVTQWSAAGIPFTTCSVTSTGALQLTHTEGGVILVNDIVQTGGSKGASQQLMSAAGFIPNSTNGVKYGPFSVLTYTPSQSSTTGVGTNLQITVTNDFQSYSVNPTVIPNGGSGYVVGDEVTFTGNNMGGTTPGNNLTVVVTATGLGGQVLEVSYVSGTASAVPYTTLLSNWYPLTYTANEGAPVAAPANGTNWFYSVVNQVDIMVNYNGAWYGYKNIGYDYNGFPSTAIPNVTDPDGPIISASEPSLQSDGTPLVYGDLWVDTSDLENYPVMFRWQFVDGIDKWVRIDNTNNVDPTGILFADARWATNGTTNPADDPIPSIGSLLVSNYLDLDAPEPTLYPTGMLLFNLRRSGYNVKQYRVNYFNNDRFPDAVLPTQRDAWVTASGLQSNGSPFMGRKAQRNMVVQAMRVAIDTNTSIRDEDQFFNLMATPNYPELQPNMVVLNADRGDTGFIIGDTPMRLADNATDIQAWATNAAGATSTGEDGCVTRSTYMGLFYPSGIAPEPVNGNLVAVPPSHMMIRTFLRNDTIAYPWLAPAGTRRGLIDNATNIGYVDSATGEFITTRTRVGIRDVLYTNFINPLVFFTGNGLLNYGNKSSFNSLSALDRINVARLVAYIRRQLTIAARPFVFEPNDALTRTEISGVVDTLFLDLVAKRGVYDYLVVCDESNNTPARIDRNELWIDVAIEPVKAAEFIYIPVRIFNTGEL